MKQLIILLAISAAVVLIIFYFVPAFRGEIVISPTIGLGWFSVRWYGLTMAAAILWGYLSARKQAWWFGIDPREIDHVAFWLTVVGLASARAYYVIFDFEYFRSQPWEIVKLWHGGQSIYGGLLGGLGFLGWYARRKAFGFYQLTDVVALSLPLGQALGRLGNFFNQEAYGAVTALPWKMYVARTGQYHHPAFLYELLASIAIFIFLTRLAGRVQPGGLTFLYLVLYSLARFMIEPLRVDSVFLAGWRVDQIVALLIIVGAGVVWWRRRATFFQA